MNNRPEFIARLLILAIFLICASCKSSEVKQSDNNSAPPKISDKARNFLSDYETALKNQEEERKQAAEEEEALEQERIVQNVVNQTIEELLALDPQKDAGRMNELIGDLKEIGDVASGALKEMLTENRNEKEKFLLIKAIGAFKGADAGDMLYDHAIKSREKATRDAALDALKNTATGETLANGVISRMKEQTPEDRVRSLSVLGALGGDAAISEMIHIIETSEDDDVRRQAISSLGQIGGDEAKATLIDVFKKGGKMCGPAAGALGRMGQEEIVLQLGEMLLSADATAEMKTAAVEGLGADNGELARTILINALKDATLVRDVHQKAVDVLIAGFSEKTTCELSLYMAVFESTPIDYLPQMMQQLLSRGGDYVVDIIFSRYGYLPETKKIHAIRTLARIQTKKSFARLTDIIQSESNTALKRESLSAVQNFKGDAFMPQLAAIAEELLGSARDRETIIISIDIIKNTGSAKSKNVLLAFKMKDGTGEYGERIEDAIATIKQREK